jgi:hypothetical protein
MKDLLKSYLKLSFLIIIIGLSVQSSQAQDSEENIKQELFQLEQALNVGVQTHDTAALKKILANEYQLSGPRFTEATPRVQWLSNVPAYSVDSVAITNITVSNWGEIAVFRSLQHFYNLKIGGRPGPYNDAWITDLWVKREGSWQLVTRLSERVPKK